MRHVYDPLEKANKNNNPKQRHKQCDTDAILIPFIANAFALTNTFNMNFSTIVLCSFINISSILIYAAV